MNLKAAASASDLYFWSSRGPDTRLGKMDAPEAWIQAEWAGLGGENGGPQANTGARLGKRVPRGTGSGGVCHTQ